MSPYASPDLSFSSPSKSLSPTDHPTPVSPKCLVSSPVCSPKRYEPKPQPSSQGRRFTGPPKPSPRTTFDPVDQPFCENNSFSVNSFDSGIGPLTPKWSPQDFPPLGSRLPNITEDIFK